MLSATVRPIRYLSGPYSAGNGRTVADNIETARTYAVRAWEMGWAAITPHLNTAGFEHLCTGVEHDDWLAGDLAILDRLDPARDAVLMLPRWILSRGAKIEHEAALSRNLQVYYADAIAGGVPEVPK